MTDASTPDFPGEQDLRRLLDQVYQRWGVDFRDYAAPSITRRVTQCMRAEAIANLDDYLRRLLEDAECMERFARAVTVHVTTMFRDPDFYRAFREKVVPMLRPSNFLRIWHAGCSTGEEAYSLAVLLEEAGLGSRSRIYATDMSESVLRRARQGIFPLAAVREFTGNYLRSGGTRAFSDYYRASYNRAVLRSFLRERIVFSRHDLANDGPFNTFDVVLCRNVLIYFNLRLAERVHRLLYDSLAPGGFLGLGARETVRFSPHERHYHPIDADARLYRKTPLTDRAGPAGSV